jgi:hypothetical protein
LLARIVPCQTAHAVAGRRRHGVAVVGWIARPGSPGCLIRAVVSGPCLPYHSLYAGPQPSLSKSFACPSATPSLCRISLSLPHSPSPLPPSPSSPVRHQLREVSQRPSKSNINKFSCKLLSNTTRWKRDQQRGAPTCTSGGGKAKEK